MLRKLASPAWAILEHGSYPLMLLLATPWFIHQLGTELYGNWMLLTATISLAGIMNSGTGAATIKAVSAAIGRDTSDSTGQAINNSLAISIAGGALLGFIVFLAFYLGSHTFLGRMGNPAIVQQTGIAAAVLVCLEQIDNTFSSAIKGAEHFGDAARIEIGSKLLQVIVAAVVLYIHPGLTALYISLCVLALLRLIAKAVVAKRLLQLQRIRLSLKNAGQILQFAKWGWLQGLGTTLFGVADRMLIGSLLGANSLTYYSIASQLAMQVHAIAAAGLSVIFPNLSRRFESGDSFSLKRYTKIAVLGNLLLSSGLAIALYAIGPTFLGWWIGSELAAETEQLLSWLIIAYWMLSLNTVFYYILLGMGRIKLISITVLVSGLFAIITAYAAISSMGLLGAPLGRAVYAVLSLTLAIPVFLHLRREKQQAPT